MTTIMRPFQCDLQPEIQETHRTTHTGTTIAAEHRRGTNSRMKRPQPQPPHTRGIFHRRPQPLHMEKHKVSCSGFIPKTKPMLHSCSHHNALRTCHMKRRWIKVVPRLPRKVPRRPGRHGRPSQSKRATQCHECHACHAKRWWM